MVKLIEREDNVKSEEKEQDAFKNWPMIKIHIFCPTLMKLGENDELMR